MLEGVPVKIHIMIVIVRVGKKFILLGKDKRGTQIGSWQHGIGRVFNFENVFLLVVEILSLLIPQIGVGVTVAD